MNRTPFPPRKRQRSRAILLLPALGLAAAVHALAAGDDAVNERPPVSHAQREQHWGVDCTALRRELLAALDGGALQHEAPRAPDWIKALRLCAAIYNVPGDSSAAACPDYTGAANALAADDALAQQKIREALLCAP